MNRLNCAIEHLDLRYVESIQSSDHLVAVCKHLCGSATDYTIRCLQNANIKLNGFVFAPCCHHRCTYNQYVGKDQLNQLKLVTSEQQFNLLKHISTWAVCGFRPKLSIDNQQQQLSYEDERKTIVGQKAKALIEFGRIQYLIDRMGFRVHLCRYIDASVSPENLLIVGIDRDYISTASKG
jgi:tRNA:m4X modification enzyme